MFQRVKPDGYQDGLVAEEKYGKTPEVCPLCGCTSVVIYGRYEREFRREFQRGADGLPEQINEVQESKYIERTTHVSCPKCKAFLEVRPDWIFEIIDENIRLRMAAKADRKSPQQTNRSMVN